MRVDDGMHLLNKISQGDTDAFAVLFKMYKDVTYSYAIKICQSSVLAEEIVQDVFMNIWINRKKLNEIENFGGYIRVITRNQTLQVLRHIAVETRYKTRSAEDWQEQHNETEIAIEYNESRHILNKALQSLPPQQKLIYQMCHLQGMKQQDVAEQLHISPLTVKAHLRQAVRRVRELFMIEAAIWLLFIIKLF